MASALIYKGKFYGDEIPVEDNYDPESKLPISGKGVAEALGSKMVDVINAQSDNEHYPTAKAVYDFVMSVIEKNNN